MSVWRGILNVIKSIIGSLTDHVGVPYAAGSNTVMAHLNTAYYHIHGTSFVYPDKADSVLLTSGAGAWDTTGAITEVVPSGGLAAAPFDLHWIDVSNISDNSEGVIDIYKGGAGAEVKIGSCRIYRNAVMSQEGSKRIQIPQQAAGERISCKLSTDVAGAITCSVAFSGHYYAG